MVLGALSLDQVTIGAFFGLLLSLPIALFLVYWLSAVKNRTAVIMGGLAGAFIAFLVILGWAGTLFFSQPIPGANGASAFFGGVLLCSAAGLVGGIVVDLIVARRNSRDYRRQVSHE
ncbi:hypothetical protein KDH_43330 [Dictyobacter sp. S3.2.2.5]|uniref:PTS sucrose transporter subunit IIBC n=1 Tax=Dictyobacter halimunensis TaxID=3026934 RepID=A0ABQ6FTA0_9CHLR|nr:hypothetical protein KDH_43330 [Dictyobacter sp. S3.2.2.5]